MNIVIAPDAFKGSLSSRQAGQAMLRGVRRVLPRARCRRLAIADGGEGTVQALLEAAGGRWVQKTVRGPAGGRVTARYAILADGTAVIEMAAASGLSLLGARARDPLKTTSFGTGQLIADALDRGAERIIVGVGGSATVDGGAGMAQALGVRFRDAGGRVIRRAGSGGMLDRIAAIDREQLHPRLHSTGMVVAADVDNPLCGGQGAAVVFGPQKGAGPAAARRLDANLRHYARLLRDRPGQDIARLPGAGAAGGLAAGLVAFAGAEIRSGIDLVLDRVGLENALRGADLVLTGEGHVDRQTGRGKAPLGVARVARRQRVPVVLIGGGLADDAGYLFRHGVDGLEAAVARDMPPAQARRRASALLANAAERAVRLILIGRNMP